MKNTTNVVQKGNAVFLRIGEEWYSYNQTDRPLGEGAMGTVYLGRSCRTNEKVAIKRVVDKYANVPAIRKRAQLEASMLFRHKNLIEMIGYCEINPHKGPIFIISRLVQGITLDIHVNKNLRNRPDAVKRICETLYPVFDALSYIHSRNIVHLDIKPSNIMLENGCNIRLMDLGIAFTDDTVNMTSPGLIGTPKYAAPEQYVERGQNSLQVDNTTDLYELGVTIYELLTGYNPFDSLTREGTLEKQRKEILPYIPGVPDEIVNVLRKATDKIKVNRFQSAQEFKVALQNALATPTRKNNKWLLPVCIGFTVGAIIILLLIRFI